MLYKKILPDLLAFVVTSLRSPEYDKDHVFFSTANLGHVVYTKQEVLRQLSYDLEFTRAFQASPASLASSINIPLALFFMTRYHYTAPFLREYNS
jgi:hypothetical protein